MPRSKSSKRWLQEHFDDIYVKKAQAEGYRSRAVYKLEEVDRREHLLKPGMVVVDLGAAPGGWSQYVAERLQERGKIIALDILPMDAIADVHCITGDFTSDEVLARLKSVLPSHGVDLVLSDMAPNWSGNPVVDIPKAMYLAELAFDFAADMLKPGGNLLMKIFHGSGFDEIIRSARLRFEKVVIRKPEASRARSRETYLLAKGHKVV